MLSGSEGVSAARVFCLHGGVEAGFFRHKRVFID